MKALDCLYREMRACRRCRLAEIKKNREKKLLPRIGGNFLVVGQNPSFYYSPGNTSIWGGLDSLPLARFEKFLDTHGFSIADLSVTNLVKCTFPDNAIPPDVDNIVKMCSHWLMTEIKLLNPCCIIAMGALARNFFNLKLGQKRYFNFIPTFCTKHPRYVSRIRGYEEFFKVFEEALERKK